MTRRPLAVAIALVCALAATSAHARHHKADPLAAGFSFVTLFCGDRVCPVFASVATPAKPMRSVKRQAARRRVATGGPLPTVDPRRQTGSSQIAGTNEPPALVKPAWPRGIGTEAEYCPRDRRGRIMGSTSLARIVPPLKEKIEAIVAACGAKVVSTDCRGGVTTNHREHTAVDVSMPKGKSYACIYARLQGWPGGYTTDFRVMGHVHVSYNRKHEWGLRFVHGSRDRARFAARRGASREVAAGHDRYAPH